MIDSTTAFQIDWSGWWVTRVAITGTTKTSVLESSYSYNNIRPSVCVQRQSFLCLIVFFCLVMNAVPDVEYKRKYYYFSCFPGYPAANSPLFTCYGSHWIKAICSKRVQTLLRVWMFLRMVAHKLSRTQCCWNSNKRINFIPEWP